jgi:hypothetical protein
MGQGRAETRIIPLTSPWSVIIILDSNIYVFFSFYMWVLLFFIKVSPQIKVHQCTKNFSLSLNFTFSGLFIFFPCCPTCFHLYNPPPPSLHKSLSSL